VQTELGELLRKKCVHACLWKVIFWGCCNRVLCNHQYSPIANCSRKRYLSVAHVQDAQYNKQQGESLTERENRPPIRLKMKVGGLEFEIECQEDQLQATVDKILSTVTDKLKEMPFIAERSASPPRAETCKGVIQKLWEDGWFAAPKGLSEVHSELARRGFHYDRTAVAHALIDLVKDGILTREGRPRRYRYAQKRPPSYSSIPLESTRRFLI